MRVADQEKYFHIVTDPEDVPTACPLTRPKKDPHTEEDTEPKVEEDTEAKDPHTEEDTEPKAEEDTEAKDPHTEGDTEPKDATTKKQQEPKKYITIDDSGKFLCAKFMIKKNKRKTAFKLKNLVDDKTYPLSRSQWLPEASLGSQPYAICRRGQSFHRKMKTVCIKNELVTYSSTENDSDIDSSLFILERGRIT